MHEKWRQTYGTFIVCVVVQTKVQWPSNPRRILPEVLDGKGICWWECLGVQYFPMYFFLKQLIISGPVLLDLPHSVPGPGVKCGLMEYNIVYTLMSKYRVLCASAEK